MKTLEAVFEKPDFLSPKKVLEEIGLEPGDIVVDYGSGPGHWAIPAARIVAPKGLVYAFEDNIDILKLLKSKAELLGVTNIEIEEVNIEKEKTKQDIDSDLVILANVLHSTKDKIGLLNRASEVLGKGGQLLLIDWSQGKGLFGPNDNIRLSEEEVMTLCDKADLHFVCTVNAGWHHFGMLFDKGDEHEKRRKSKSGK